jgi:hypothetical protein
MEYPIIGKNLKMDLQKAAGYALMVFQKTYTCPDDIFKAFRPTIREMVLFSNVEKLRGEELEGKMKQFAEDVWGQMNYVSLDIVRSRISEDIASGNFEIALGQNNSTQDGYFKKLTPELMKALIHMHYRDYKKVLKAPRKRLAASRKGKD